jgi:hypothetical protein
VPQYIPKSGDVRTGVEIQSALPKSRREAEELDTMYDGPIWRLVGNVRQFELRNDPLSDEETQSLLGQFGEAYRSCCDQNKVKPVSQAALEDAFYFQRSKRMVPTGVHPVKWAAERARSDPLPPQAARYGDDEPRRLLVGVCWHLATLNGNQKPFFVSCRDLEAHLGFHGHSKWATILQQLCAIKPPVLRVISQGRQFTTKGSQASEYEFLTGGN